MNMPHNLPLNLFDLIVLTVVGLSALLSFFRGLFKEVFSLAGWAVAAVVTLRFLEPVSHLLKPHVGSDVVASGIASVGLFFITLVLISIVSGIIIKYIKPGAKVGLIDNLGGLAFGVARGALIITLGYFIMSIVVGEKNYPVWINQSYSKPYVERSATWMKEFAPEYLEKLTGKKSMGAEITTPLESVADRLGSGKDKSAPQAVSDTGRDMKEESQKMPSFEDLQQRIKQENESGNVR